MKPWDKFGRLTLLQEAARTPRHQRRWLCRCACGTEKVITEYPIQAGLVVSCGCWGHSGLTRTHGLSKSPTYRSWNQMKQRCLNPDNPNFPDYGGRGITVCDSWLTFTNFLADMGERPSPTRSIERLDNNLGYMPDNCIWATPQHQANNRRTNRVLTFRGESLTLAEWGRRTGMPVSRIGLRLDRYGWSIEDALTLSRQPHRRKRHRPNQSPR